MARCVFFSFHFEDSWMVNQVRHKNVVHGKDRAGYIDHSEYLDAEGKGQAAVNGLLGIYIHHLSDRPNKPLDALGALGALGAFLNSDLDGNPPLPPVPRGLVFPVYRWDGDVSRFSRMIEEAGQRADASRDRLVRAAVLRRLARGNR